MSKQDFLLRLDPDIYERLQEQARKEGLSMTALVRQGVEMRLDRGEKASSAAMRMALDAVSDLCTKLAEGWRMVPPDSPPGLSWDDLINEGSS
jgi:Ribbon-helix-helix protein, copG family